MYRNRYNESGSSLNWPSNTKGMCNVLVGESNAFEGAAFGFDVKCDHMCPKNR